MCEKRHIIFLLSNILTSSHPPKKSAKLLLPMKYKYLHDMEAIEVMKSNKACAHLQSTASFIYFTRVPLISICWFVGRTIFHPHQSAPDHPRFIALMKFLCLATSLLDGCLKVQGKSSKLIALLSHWETYWLFFSTFCGGQRSPYQHVTWEISCNFMSTKADRTQIVMKLCGTQRARIKQPSKLTQGGLLMFQCRYYVFNNPLFYLQVRNEQRQLVIYQGLYLDVWYGSLNVAE